MSDTTLLEIQVLRAAIEVSPHPTISLGRERVLWLLDLAERGLQCLDCENAKEEKGEK